MDRTNQIMQLANNEKYAVLKQFNEPEATYYFTVGVAPDESDVTDEYVVFKETIVDGKTCVEEVRDPKIIEKLDLKFEEN